LERTIPATMYLHSPNSGIPVRFTWESMVTPEHEFGPLTVSHGA
jgi:hypothetical protein